MHHRASRLRRVRPSVRGYVNSRLTLAERCQWSQLSSPHGLWMPPTKHSRPVENSPCQKILTRPNSFTPRIVVWECRDPTWPDQTRPADLTVLWTSRASAAALSTMLRTTTLSYGNRRFAGTCPAETPQPIKSKFRMIDYVGEITRCAKNNCNRLAGSGPTDRWNITSKTVLTIPYLTLPYLTLLYFTFFSCNRLQQKRLNRFAPTIAQTTRFAVRKCFWGSRW
jgi:hypothetical protein